MLHDPGSHTPPLQISEIKLSTDPEEKRTHVHFSLASRILSLSATSMSDLKQPAFPLVPVFGLDLYYFISHR